jgi:class 3 adenylate cyclase
VQEFRKARSRALAFFLPIFSDKSHMKKTVLEDFRSSLVASIPATKSSHVIENLFQYELPVSSEEIWPYVADTSRMNKELGFPPRVETEINGETHVTTKTLGRAEEWIEKPWVWIDGKELQSFRVFKKGWMTEQLGVFTVRKTESGCQVSAYFRWSFSNIFSKLLFSSAGNFLNKSFQKFFDDKAKIIISMRALVKHSIELNEPDSPYETFLEYLKTADDLDLDRLHLKKISQIINLPLDLLLSVTHQMVKEGYLSLSWDVVCPHCRGVRAENSGLSSIEMKNACAACEIDFGLDMEESVEVVFRVTEKIRSIKKVVYCAAEPAKKRHIKLNQTLSAGEMKNYSLNLRDGLYRIRSKHSTEVLYLEVKPSEVEHVEWNCKESGRKTVNTDFVLSLICDKDTTITLEETWWFNDRLLPREVLSNSLMRSLFSLDHLKAGVNLNVGHQVIMFTDIVGSTPFYKSQGDARAFKAVQDHYKEVSELISSHKGVVIKYIGDAVMAAFLDHEDAFHCSVKIHETFNETRQDTPIKLRISFHHGPVLCANMNVGLDYFGNTVNQAAKIQKWAGSFEVAVTEEDWKSLEGKVKKYPVRQEHDEKLNLDIRILNLK